MEPHLQVLYCSRSEDKAENRRSCSRVEDRYPKRNAKLRSRRARSLQTTKQSEGIRDWDDFKWGECGRPLQGGDIGGSMKRSEKGNHLEDK